MGGISDQHHSVFGPFLDMLNFGLQNIKGLKVFYSPSKIFDDGLTGITTPI